MTPPAVTLRVPETATRRYATNADRQRAYRQRCREARGAAAPATPFPPRPALATLPADRRWRALLRQAQQLLETAQGEMQAYYDQRSAAWQEGERGEAFQERLDALAAANDALAELDD